MEITVSHAEGRVPVTVFQLEGELTVNSYEALQRQAEKDYEMGMRHLLLDLSQVTYLSSSGLRGIHHVYELLRGTTTATIPQEIRSGLRSGQYKSAHLKLLNPQERVLQTLKGAGFDMFLEIYANQKEAIGSF